MCTFTTKVLTRARARTRTQLPEPGEAAAEQVELRADRGRRDHRRARLPLHQVRRQLPLQLIADRERERCVCAERGVYLLCAFRNIGRRAW